MFDIRLLFVIRLGSKLSNNFWEILLRNENFRVFILKIQLTPFKFYLTSKEHPTVKSYFYTI